MIYSNILREHVVVFYFSEILLHASISSIHASIHISQVPQYIDSCYQATVELSGKDE